MNRKMLRFLLPLGLFLAMAVFLGIGLNRDPREVPSPLIGKPAPEFKLATLADPGKAIGRADLLGKVWMLNVWASWCVACREEHPLLVQYSRQKRVPIYGLNYKDQRADGQAWLSQFGNPYTESLHDLNGRVGLDFGVYGVPETFIIDREGVVRFKHIGPITPQVIRERIEPMLKALDA